MDVIQPYVILTCSTVMFIISNTLAKLKSLLYLCMYSHLLDMIILHILNADILWNISEMSHFRLLSPFNFGKWMSHFQLGKQLSPFNMRFHQYSLTLGNDCHSLLEESEHHFVRHMPKSNRGVLSLIGLWMKLFCIREAKLQYSGLFYIQTIWYFVGSSLCLPLRHSLIQSVFWFFLFHPFAAPTFSLWIFFGILGMISNQEYRVVCGSDMLTSSYRVKCDGFGACYDVGFCQKLKLF